MNVVESSWRAFVKPPPLLKPWEWAELHVDIGKISPIPGMFRADTAPWIKEPLEKFADNRIRRIVVRCAAQTGKTTFSMICVNYQLANDPGPAQWIMAAADEAKTFVNTRLKDFLSSCKPVAEMMPKKRTDNKTLEINFPGAPLLVTGANSTSKLQGNPKRYIFPDEVRNWPKGALQTVLKRTDQYWNAREVLTSTGDAEGDDMDREFMAGDQRHYYMPCPHCGQEWHMEFKQLKWDENESTRPGGEWDYDELAKTIRYECPACKVGIQDNFEVRKKMAIAGKWVPHNTKAPSDRVSYTWPALIAPLRPWKRIVQEFLMAKEALDMGAHEPMKTWVTETMGQSWREDMLFSDDVKVDESFKMGGVWEKEVFRFLTVDVQKDHYWYVVRAWSKVGESMLISCGRLNSESDIEEARRAHNVFQDAVIVDCGYEQNEVAKLCAARGWTAFKGDDSKSFPSFSKPTDGSQSKRIELPYTFPPRFIDPGVGTAEQNRMRCRLFLWSNPTIKDFLFRLKTGRGMYWGVPGDAPKEHIQHMSSEMKKKERNKKTGQSEYRWVVIGRRQNHLWDCECMQLVAAMLQGLVPNPFASFKSAEVPANA